MPDHIIISKFGGSSVADLTAMERSVIIAHRQNSSIVLVSATYGTTDTLLEMIERAEAGDWRKCSKILNDLKEKHFKINQNLNSSEDIQSQLQVLFDELKTLVRGVSLLKQCTPKAEDQILSFGERMSSLLVAEVYRNLYSDKDVKHFDIRKVMITDGQHTAATPQLDLIAKNAKTEFKLKKDRVYISQGFIGQSMDGATTTLGRGGSDYSAALIAEAVDADLLEIWTDVAGIATTDPRIYTEARPIHEISYDEASEMAKYGAKILHPTTLVPAMRKSIPVYVGSSFDDDARGTWIKKDVKEKPLIRALAKRNDQALLTIRTPEMLNAVGFMNSIFKVFANHNISVDCVTTSEISVAISIDRSMMEHKELINDLEDLGTVTFETGHALISLIGNDILSTRGLAKDTFHALKGINIRMVCLGASAYNFNILVEEGDCDLAIQRLHKKFIGI